ncbi:hypothetical protein D3C87_1424160 [compost metagenome]
MFLIAFTQLLSVVHQGFLCTGRLIANLDHFVSTIFGRLDQRLLIRTQSAGYILLQQPTVVHPGNTRRTEDVGIDIGDRTARRQYLIHLFRLDQFTEVIAIGHSHVANF